ncbi:hypothetical protein [Streptomyces violaceusniger]|uniref:Uncharacterized protein n=1 Tax=Streptomyces violaceusniger (strain Tu 4113) TaxID=653045 RepID=G2PGT8_STRV4|nr:hypothetical protein [Streptomyces violaceusniger]AEM88652.1 hypothetical protein Strvi_9395 [Streptomyces violaceusniger Tu 4113]
MTDPTARLAESGWLAAATAAHEEQQLEILASQLLQIRRHADLINSRLADLGIEPVHEASVDRLGNLRSAKLLDADHDRGTYEVRAYWGEDTQAVELHTADRSTDPTGSAAYAC